MSRATPGTVPPASRLAAELEDLFRLQGESWPLLANGIHGLREARTRSVLAAGSEVLVRHIPHRAASTTAKVDRASIAKRPCFLCEENLYPEQVGIAFGPSHAIYCNPFPVVGRHVTVVHRDHRPQRIEGQLETMLSLAEALPGYFIVYNGPECGASAPDHAHLQAGSSEGLPLLREVAGVPGPAIEVHGLRALLFRSRERPPLRREIGRALGVLASVTAKSPEPLCNVAVFRELDGGLAAVVFPRARHRPAAYFTGELTVSPAAIDVAGILVAPVPGDFERLTGRDVESVFREVTLPEAQFREAVARLAGGATRT
jgi:hypothetical protein